jgi:hypothetical protein
VAGVVLRARREPLDAVLVDEQANRVLDSEPVGDLARDRDDRERQPEVVDELLALDAEQLRDDQLARADHGVIEPHRHDATALADTHVGVDRAVSANDADRGLCRPRVDRSGEGEFDRAADGDDLVGADVDVESGGNHDGPPRPRPVVTRTMRGAECGRGSRARRTLGDTSAWPRSSALGHRTASSHREPSFECVEHLDVVGGGRSRRGLKSISPASVARSASAQVLRPPARAAAMIDAQAAASLTRGRPVALLGPLPAGSPLEQLRSAGEIDPASGDISLLCAPRWSASRRAGRGPAAGLQHTRW